MLICVKQPKLGNLIFKTDVFKKSCTLETYKTVTFNQ